MFKKLLAKLGKGSATIDLQIDRSKVSAGEIISGQIHIKGGEVNQEINGIDVDLEMEVVTKKGDRITRKIAGIPVTNSFLIHSKEEKIFPFTFNLSNNYAISSHSVSYFFHSNLDIEGGFDRKDNDSMVILPSKNVQNIFSALERLGFREKSKSGELDQYGQEFRFFPTTIFNGEISELELRFADETEGLRIWIELDCRTAFGEIEARRELYLTTIELADRNKLSQRLKELLEETEFNPNNYVHPHSYKQETIFQNKVIGNPLTSMVGSLAVGLLGGMLLEEVLDSNEIDEMMGDASDLVGDIGFFGEEE